MESRNQAAESVETVRRRRGKLYSITTSAGRSFLVLRDESTERLLVEGEPLAPGDAEALEGPIARTAGLALVYRLLAGRDRSEREVRDALAKEGIATPETVRDIVDTLRRQGYLDDRRLASHYVQYAAKHRPSGPRLVRRKLREIGVGEEIIEEKLREALPPERERELATALARRRLRGAKSREQAVRRVHALLARRGFSDRVVNDICAAILRGTLSGEDE